MQSSTATTITTDRAIARGVVSTVGMRLPIRGPGAPSWHDVRVPGTDRSRRPLAEGVEIRGAREDEVEDLLPLMRGYCDFYEADPSDEGLRSMARELIGDPEQGAMVIARDGDGGAIGFAAMDWKWSSLRGSRIGYLE